MATPDRQYCRGRAPAAAARGRYGMRLALWIAAAGAVLAATAADRAAEITAGWRLLRTPNPLGGEDAVAITHTADTMRSDPDFVGLMLRCSQIGPEAIVILIVPLQPGAAPQVILASGDDRVIRVEATVGTPASAIILPRSATAALLGPWRGHDEVSITVDAAGQTIRGVVAIAGLDQALRTLNLNCLVKP